MSREALAQSVLELRTKAAQGVFAVMAARDLQARLPAELTELVAVEIDTGTLEARWAAALADASDTLPGEPAGEVALHALAAMLAWQQAQAKAVVCRYAEQIEVERRALESRADGIEQAMAALPESA